MFLLLMLVCVHSFHLLWESGLGSVLPLSPASTYQPILATEGVFTSSKLNKQRRALVP